MGTKLSHTQLMIPVYINEKIVLDMLAIIEDGFSRSVKLILLSRKKVLRDKQEVLALLLRY